MKSGLIFGLVLVQHHNSKYVTAKQDVALYRTNKNMFINVLGGCPCYHPDIFKEATQWPC